MSRGYCAIGIDHVKTPVNVGTLWRSAYNLGASAIFTIGRRYPQQGADTVKAWRHIPLFEFRDAEDLIEHLPYGCPLVGVEIDERSKPLQRFHHPERACYVLGAEDHGLTKEVADACHFLVEIPSNRCLNVAVAGSIVLYDRNAKTAA